MTIAKKVPQVAYGTTVGIRFCNNVIGERGTEGLEDDQIYRLP